MFIFFRKYYGIYKYVEKQVGLET